MYNNNLPAWEKHYRRDRSKQSVPDENVVRYLNRYFDSFAEKSEEATSPPQILDLGAGSGRHLNYLRTFPGKAFGMDYSLNALHGQEGVVCADAKSLPFASASFDLILCWGVFHYLPDESIAGAISEVRRILRPYGRFFGTLRSTEDTHLEEVLDQGDLAGGAARLFTQEEAAALFRGFSEIRFGFIARRPLGEEGLIAHHMIEASL